MFALLLTSSVGFHMADGPPASSMFPSPFAWENSVDVSVFSSEDRFTTGPLPPRVKRISTGSADATLLRSRASRRRKSIRAERIADVGTRTSRRR
ncbi:hypothetical protein EYF80_025155 [Liparis tanakae]|uniref:Secreted protein n=1 Tax=Liparis tanakae TaxID=230148 RepID=A0A4Z2HFZ4_9TELE|nr:hypothetical protein EYF80_025155 [Liparis tanakae]